MQQQQQIHQQIPHQIRNWGYILVSKLQGIITLSSTEVEYLATVEAGKEIHWM